MICKTLYVSDLDGTLLRPDATVSAFTAETLRALTAEGMLFSYATARSWLTARKVTAALGALHLPVIVQNGAAIVDSADGKVLQALYFTGEEKAFLLETLLEAGLSPIGYSRGGGGTSSHDERVAVCTDRAGRGLRAYLESRQGDERFWMTDRAHLGDGRVYYFTCIVDDRAEAEPAYAAVMADGRFTVILQRDIYCDCWYFEIMPKEATKANAAKRLAGMYRCGRIVCFGDGVNDLSLFEAAEEGYAVANGAPELKRAATGIIGPNTEDGVAKKLAELWKRERKETK